MRQLRLDVLSWKAVLPQQGGGNMPEAVASLAAFVAHAPQGHVEGHVAAWLGAVVAAREEQGIAPVQFLELAKYLQSLL